MAIRRGDRTQQTLFPQSLEEYVKADDPVRAYDAMIDVMDLKSLGLDIIDNKVGNSKYDPVLMLKLLVYGYSYCCRSSRKLERAIYHNTSFMWLMGGLQPDHKTISKFRKDNKKVLEEVLKQSVRICVKLNLVEGNTLFLDGTKLKANASNYSSLSVHALSKKLKKIDIHIKKILEESENFDSTESGSYVSLSEELKDKEVLKDKIKKQLDELKFLDVSSVSLTDRDSRKVKSGGRYFFGYNGQATMDEKHGLITSTDVVTDGNDFNQFSQQISNAIDNTGLECETAVADAGYSKVDNIIEIDEKGIDVVMPNQKEAAHNPKEKEFDKYDFIYNEERNDYTCPIGEKLPYRSIHEKRGIYVYQITKGATCEKCKHFGSCTKSKNGRIVTRLINEKLKEKLSRRYQSKAGRKIYHRRKQVAELPFGHIKENLKAGSLLIRGLDGAKAEFALLCSCFNITRMTNIFDSVSEMVLALKMLKIS